MNSGLPKGWTHATIAEVTETVPNIKPEDFPERHFGYVDISSVDNESFQITGVKTFKGKDAPSRARRPIKPGDVLFSNVRTYLRNVALVKESEAAEVCSTGFTVLRPTDAILPRYLFRYILTNAFIEAVSPRQTGTHYPATSDRVVRAELIPLPPISEQARIVATLERLLSQVDDCKKRLAKVPTILKRFRQSVLATACSGRLTVDWRERNAGTASARNLISLLKSPPTERHFDTFEKSSSIELPQSWEWVRLGELGPILGGGTPSKDKVEYWNGDIPWVTPKDMKRDRIQDSGDHITERAVQDSHLNRIPAGSILFVVRGMILNHTFPTAVTDRMVTVNQDMKALVPEIPEMSEYLVLVSKHIASAILFEVKEATHGTRRIETALLKNWAIPVPPLSEQREIVRRVKALFSIADGIQARYAKAEQQAGKLNQSILAKAFRGELVPTEAELAKAEGRDYESAEELLQRIKMAGRAEQPAKRNRAEIGKSQLMLR